MSTSLLLTVVTPLAVVLDALPVQAVRAADRSGWFGILPSHGDLLTVLEVSVLVYRDPEGREHFVGVRGGVLQVSGRRHVRVTTREALLSDDLPALQQQVKERLQKTAQDEATIHSRLAHLESAVLHRMADYLRTANPTLTSPQGGTK